jgi:hypothetical protein
MNSIKNMHLKITGVPASNLQVLWRWLKEVGQTYSSFRRWRTKAKEALLIGGQKL